MADGEKALVRDASSRRSPWASQQVRPLREDKRRTTAILYPLVWRTVKVGVTHPLVLSP